MSERAKANIKIENVKATIKALQYLEPDLYKRMNSEIRRSLSQVRKLAQVKYPKGGYAVRINQKQILGSVYAVSGGTRAPRWGDSSPGIRAAIFEFAGSKGDGESPQARAMIESLNKRYGQPGRFLWSAWDELGSDVLQDIEASVKAAERDLQSRLDAAGESY